MRSPTLKFHASALSEVIRARRKGLGGVLCLSSTGRRSRCYGGVNNEEDTSELDKDFAEHCNEGCGVRRVKVRYKVD